MIVESPCDRFNAPNIYNNCRKVQSSTNVASSQISIKHLVVKYMEFHTYEPSFTFQLEVQKGKETPRDHSKPFQDLFVFTVLFLETIFL